MTSRREFIMLLGGAAAWPLAASGQQRAMPVVGFLHSATLETARDSVAGFHRGLSETGYVEGRNVAIEYRFAENQSGRLPALAAELTRRLVTVLFAGGPPAALAAKAATATIPVVFTSGADPVKLGLVASLNMPGGNVTGVNIFAGVLGAKRLGLLRELVAPNAGVIGVLLNPNGPEAEPQLNDIRAAAQALGQQILVVNAGNEQDIHSLSGHSCNRGSARCWLVPIHSSLADGSSSSRWPPTMRFQPSTRIERMLWPVA